MVVAGDRFKDLQLTVGCHVPHLGEALLGRQAVGRINPLGGRLVDGRDIASEPHTSGGTSGREPAASVIFENDRTRTNDEPPFWRRASASEALGLKIAVGEADRAEPRQEARDHAGSPSVYPLPLYVKTCRRFCGPMAKCTQSNSKIS